MPKKIWYAPNKFEAYGEEEIKAVESCLRDGWLAPGPRTAEFEEKVSAFFGKKYGVFVNSGSSANLCGLAALEFKPGDEIITPACTFSTVLAPVEQLGLKAVFCDVEEGRYVPSVDQILACVTDKTVCCFIPNLVGSKPDWAELKKRLPRKDIVLFEDSCDTMTHTPESDVAAISFYASHVITAGGTGGMVMFNDEKLKKKALMFRDWGRIGDNSEQVSDRFNHDIDGIKYDWKFLYGVKGYNFKACEMNAAFGLVQLSKLDKFQKIRRENIDRFVQNLKKGGTELVLPKDHEKFDWLCLPLMSKNRLSLLNHLEANDVQTRVCMAGNITRHPAYRHYLKEFPESDRVMAEGFMLGAHHGLTPEDVDRVCGLILEWEKDQKKGGS
uniref:DegT/DnrJ/EryC1/StrS aminotransferase family protein n=1 Tax=Chromera velia CCMP2878 TaxID=1169474 RepID=A0A0G4GST1_9ALVE|mmetsp:Transcript_6742/g.13283  ORF Transcript_6742/g.13283 Transcript_6742/m.13283 type:complete len:385 (-) Transcript_6742:24-1178(-)|eukprot:Cvel_23226.t1-p1 / transcript=Cvel_23226.t1 / gene=Cvel_23226 / organism=Chromera_velia_CCMP2878 / gene_product=Lipopolysaccharide biosynthesis protein RfbH, putative / transcript_product=Lipopolysaccharide biosynthesis protein RfbH, putative / location=Cvel_scaffold2370:14506-19086(+) / protein_length=384 / sequence_SO=supercontig / SO=protein_coding / is_pseudo=false